MSGESISSDAIHAVILDLDGTLLDTAADLAAAANAVRVDFGLPELDPQRIATYVGRGADVLMHRTLTDSRDGQLSETDFTRARQAFDVHYARENGRWAQPYPGVVQGLTLMKENGVKLACVTNKPQQFTDPLLVHHQMADYFELVLGADALPRKKPDPMPLLHVAQCFDLAPAACLMIGDSVNDASAARAAGMPVLIVPYGYNEGRSAASIDCDGIVQTVLEAAARVCG